MRVAELLMLIVGAILFTVSFFMPDKSNGVAELDKEEERKQIKKLLDEGASEAKFKVEEAVDDSVNDGIEKTERALDRLTNEKISAINEYSDTVLVQIKKNHDEVMFLYDMLNNKHSQIKNTAAEINQITKSAKAATTDTPQVQIPQQQQTSQQPQASMPQAGFGYVTPNPERNNANMGFGYTEPAKKPATSTAPVSKPVVTKDVSTVDNKKEEQKLFEQIEQVQLENAAATQTAPATKKKSTKAKQSKTPVADGNLELMFATDKNANNNDRILELHKAGKSNMAIAKELGLGVGEVKLVIDLFEGI